jgi:hypothetical protein
MRHVLSVQQSPEVPSAHPLLAMMRNAARSQLLRVAAQLGIADFLHEGPTTVQQPSPQRPGGSAMRAYTPLLAFALLLVSSAPAAHAQVFFNDGETHTVTSPITDLVHISNHTVVIFNTGGNVTASSSSGGSLSAVSVVDTSRVINNGASLTGSITSGGSSTNTASGLSAADNSRVSVASGTFTGSISSTGGATTTNAASGLSAADNSQVSVSGGSFTASGATSNLGLDVLDNAEVTLFGNDFNYPFGPISDLTGTITGTLESGDSINFSFSQSRSGQIIIRR